MYDFIFLQAGGQEAPAGAFPIQILFFIAILGVFYFFMIRPQQKKQKEERVFREQLKKGDKVVTIGGIHGKVTSMNETSAVIQVDDNTKIRFEKTALRPSATE
ncbi:MAG: preprotein translocase subunit YajC [Bacteroidota bacterium]